MKKTYVVPKSDLIEIGCEGIIASSGSYNSSIDKHYCRCDENCKIWHICLDRQLYKTCLDKKGKY